MKQKQKSQVEEQQYEWNTIWKSFWQNAIVSNNLISSVSLCSVCPSLYPALPPPVLLFIARKQQSVTNNLIWATPAQTSAKHTHTLTHALSFSCHNHSGPSFKWRPETTNLFTCGRFPVVPYFSPFVFRSHFTPLWREPFGCLLRCEKYMKRMWKGKKWEWWKFQEQQQNSKESG